jgi:hypothetical protein
MAVAENDCGARGEKVKPNTWPHGLKRWIEAAKKRLHHNALAIALANKLARIAVARLPLRSEISGIAAYGAEPSCSEAL